MIEYLDTQPDVSVQEGEYKRLLGYPRDWVVSGRALELAEWARDWYAQHGRPWVYSRQANRVETCDGSICHRRLEVYAVGGCKRRSTKPRPIRSCSPR